MAACCGSWIYYFKKILGSSWQRHRYIYQHTNYWYHEKVLIFFYYFTLLINQLITHAIFFFLLDLSALIQNWIEDRGMIFFCAKIAAADRWYDLFNQILPNLPISFVVLVNLIISSFSLDPSNLKCWFMIRVSSNHHFLIFFLI